MTINLWLVIICLILISTALVTAIIFRARWKQLKKDILSRQQSVSVVSHNLRTPLSRIRFATTSLLNEIVSLSPEQQKNFEPLARQILTDTNRLTRGTTVLLEFSEVVSHEQTSNFDLTDVSQIIHEVVNDFRPTMIYKNLNFKVEVPPERLPKVTMSYFYLKTILEIILDNAQTYTSLGGTINFSVKNNKKNLIFSVTDNGIGINQQDLEHIFDRLYIPTRSVAISDSGQGMSLSVAKDIIERYGGKIQASSEGPGRGSTFSFFLPHVDN